MNHPSKFETLPFGRAKAAVQCILQGSLMEPGPFDQLLLLEKKLQKIFTGQKL